LYYIRKGLEQKAVAFTNVMTMISDCDDASVAAKGHNQSNIEFR